STALLPGPVRGDPVPGEARSRLRPRLMRRVRPAASLPRMHRPDRQGERRRKAVLLAVLAPTAAIAAWGPLTAMRADMPAAPAGAALAAAVTAGPVWWGTAGVRPERGLAALFLPAWGACVLGAAAGDGLA